MEFSEDIYSLCFCAQAANDVMDPLFDAVKGRHLNKWDEKAEEEEEEGIQEEKEESEESEESEEEEKVGAEEPEKETLLKQSTSINSPKGSEVQDEEDPEEAEEVDHWAEEII